MMDLDQGSRKTARVKMADAEEAEEAILPRFDEACAVCVGEGE
jgi:hypothetical protein